MSERRYEIGVLIGPCSQAAAERAMLAAQNAANAITKDAATSLRYWDESLEEPGEFVPDVEVVG